MKKVHSIRKMSRKKGFTLIEVMFAFMILAWGTMRLLEGLSGSVMTAKESQGIIIGSQLARMKLLDCKAELIKQGFASSSDFVREGDFDEEGFKEFTWACFGTRIDVPTPDLESLTKGQDADTSGALTGIMGQVFSTLASTLGDSARELTAVVKWKSNEEAQEIKVTTHLIDTRILAAAMSLTGPPKPPDPAKPPQLPNP